MVAYLLFLCANAMLFIRPAELLPALGNIQLYLGCILGAILFSIHDLHNQLRWRTLVQQPVNLCVLGVTFAIVTSRIATGHTEDLDTSVFSMIKVALYYLLLVSVIKTPLRLRYFLMSTAICSTLMIAYSVVDYRAFDAEWRGRPDMVQEIEKDKARAVEDRQLRHIPDRDGEDIYGNEIWFFRICGLGIFHDPNDLSLLIVATAFISVYFLSDRRLVGLRYLWLIPIGIMGVAMYYTYSRGGLLAFGVGAMAWLACRFSTKVSIALGCLCAMAVPVALGRAGNMNLSSGTGQQRIQLWSDGLAAIRNSRILFGIGEGTYYEVAGHVAHNSYVHAFVELGFFGGTLFFGCFFLPAYTFFLMKRYDFRIEDPELRRLFPYVAAILAEWGMGMCSLSRCYVPPTYMVAGLGAAFINLVGYYRTTPRPLIILNRNTIRPWLTCSAALLGGAYVFVRVFARWD
ncbi:O-antigen ligase family protein [Planctomicrobium sp. SH664]|uniref:O-antigen ligase family protein n=1 Tax=Planctomicrobium sp. SH664 TaxID=3448125 RepID=UPI003F5C6754